MNKYKNIVIATLLFSVIISTLAITNHAFGFNPNDYCPINSPFCETTTNRDAPEATINLLQILAQGLLYFAAPIAVIIIVIAGINMSANSSSQEALANSKKTLIWAAIGLFVVILSYSIVRIVISFTIKAAG